MNLSLGIDFGTSGARAIAIDPDGNIVAQTSESYSANLPQIWLETLWRLLRNLPDSVRNSLDRIAINGTSSTVLLCDDQCYPITEPLMYNDARGARMLDRIRAIAPPNHTVISSTSTLAKLLWWQENFHDFSKARYLLHQADWLAFQLHGQPGISDYHNSLKLGYDIEALNYPNWLPLQDLLPRV
ncbi:MAG: FGGY family carbohydrate kinase, partial [Leptolyngbya sp. Prado105]|nr:FGGY family carbohydrate kinase [Leptolyngbya sp. Prado105]